MLCRSCAGKGNPLYRLDAPRFALVVAVGSLAGFVAGIVLRYTNFFIFFLGAAIGGAVGQAILWAAKGRRGKTLDTTAGVTVVLGGLLSTLVGNRWRVYFAHPESSIFFLIGLGIVTAATLARLRKW